jgi:hypothetical protein
MINLELEYGVFTYHIVNGIRIKLSGIIEVVYGLDNISIRRYISDNVFITRVTRYDQLILLTVAIDDRCQGPRFMDGSVEYYFNGYCLNKLFWEQCENYAEERQLSEVIDCYREILDIASNYV